MPRASSSKQRGFPAPMRKPSPDIRLLVPPPSSYICPDTTSPSDAIIYETPKKRRTKPGSRINRKKTQRIQFLEDDSDLELTLKVDDHGKDVESPNLQTVESDCRSPVSFNDVVPATVREGEGCIGKKYINEEAGLSVLANHSDTLPSTIGDHHRMYDLENSDDISVAFGDIFAEQGDTSEVLVTPRMTEAQVAHQELFGRKRFFSTTSRSQQVRQSPARSSKPTASEETHRCSPSAAAEASSVGYNEVYCNGLSDDNSSQHEENFHTDCRLFPIEPDCVPEEVSGGMLAPPFHKSFATQGRGEDNTHNSASQSELPQQSAVQGITSPRSFAAISGTSAHHHSLLQAAPIDRRLEPHPVYSLDTINDYDDPLGELVIDPKYLPEGYFENQQSCPPICYKSNNDETGREISTRREHVRTPEHLARQNTPPNVRQENMEHARKKPRRDSKLFSCLDKSKVYVTTHSSADLALGGDNNTSPLRGCIQQEISSKRFYEPLVAKQSQRPIAPELFDKPRLNRKHIYPSDRQFETSSVVGHAVRPKKQLTITTNQLQPSCEPIHINTINKPSTSGNREKIVTGRDGNRQSNLTNQHLTMTGTNGLGTLKRLPDETHMLSKRRRKKAKRQLKRRLNANTRSVPEALTTHDQLLLTIPQISTPPNLIEVRTTSPLCSPKLSSGARDGLLPLALPTSTSQVTIANCESHNHDVLCPLPLDGKGKGAAKGPKQGRSVFSTSESTVQQRFAAPRSRHSLSAAIYAERTDDSQSTRSSQLEPYLVDRSNILAKKRDPQNLLQRRATTPGHSHRSLDAHLENPSTLMPNEAGQVGEHRRPPKGALDQRSLQKPPSMESSHRLTGMAWRFSRDAGSMSTSQTPSGNANEASSSLPVRHDSQDIGRYAALRSPKTISRPAAVRYLVCGSQIISQAPHCHEGFDTIGTGVWISQSPDTSLVLKKHRELENRLEKLEKLIEKLTSDC
ncbi:hypothetical protein BKA67DRAFT_540763 [Truncatella angustata]|uniref:Uncharacterized protein n=1 Tax=Truncatella angustata TaxID=152316 RepID=A0A9P8RGT5_9PEZI|nr:uncharacterized protein BKA67DRAFT_540763 [Truncatella angustata]KAH6645759.1 hypothetical protein BKA67DRAFT_540763 [Truncatella angustata]